MKIKKWGEKLLVENSHARAGMMLWLFRAECRTLGLPYVKVNIKLQ
jgi:hypothetical protein